MPEEHDQSTKMSLATEGAVMTEEEIRAMNRRSTIDFPMPGEVAHPEPHRHNATVSSEEARESTDADRE